MKRFLTTMVLSLGLAATAAADTLIHVGDEVLQSGVKRFGLGLAQHNYYDSAQMMKELLFRNPGFEGLLYQSVVRLGPGASADRAIEDQAFTQWPSGFWDGADYEVIWSSGSAKGRRGTILQSLAPSRQNPPNDPNGNSQGTTYVFSDSDPAKIPASGDYLVLRKIHRGGSSGGAAFASWQTNTGGGGSVTSELADLPPATAGLQCARLSAATAGQQAGVTGQFDTLTGFVRLNGAFRLAFKAKGVGGANQALVSVRRGTGTPYLSQTVQLTGDWADYSIPFTAAEAATISGTVSVSVSATGQSDLLLDDVSLRQTDGSPANPTEFRDAVVEAIAGLNPGILRYVNWQNMGNSLDNEIAPPFARMRSGYSVYSTTENNFMPGLHEFLVLCEHLDAEPWYCIPATYSTTEIANLMEYLGGPATTPYGALRAARGHADPWTGVFSRIHLEFGNENWNNSAFRGSVISQSVPCGERASELFAVIKQSSYYTAPKFQCLLGGQAGNPGLNLQLHNASSQHDTLNLAPYLSSRVDSFETGGEVDNEKLFAPLFAEPEWWSTNPSPTSGLVAFTRNQIQASSRPVPLAIYEVNLHTNQGSISQAALDAFTPSVGAAIAVSGHMLTMLKELGMRDQCFFSLAGHRTTWTATDGLPRSSALWGAVLDMGRTDRKRPHYHAVRMMNEALAGDCVSTNHSGDNPTWDVVDQNRVTFTGAHYLQSHAFRDGNRRSLLVFNYHRTQPLEVRFDGPGAPSGSVSMQRLTSDQITDHNENSEVVVPTSETIAGFDPNTPTSLPPFSMTMLQWTETSGPADQTITFPAIGDQITTATLALSATGGGSGNPVTFVVAEGPAILDPGDVLRFTGIGQVRITASQAGNESFLAATPVERSFLVTAATATIQLANLVQTYNGMPRSVTTTPSPAGLGVRVLYDGSETAPSNAGSYAVRASLVDTRYTGTASGTLTISPASQTITFAAPDARFVSEGLVLAATGGDSGYAVTFTVLDGPAVLGNGNELLFTGGGTVTIRADQGASQNHAEAESVTRSFTVVAPRPDVAVGSTPARMIGREVFLPDTRQTLRIEMKARRPATVHGQLVNHALLPDHRAADRLIVSGSGGSRRLRVEYRGDGGNLTAAIISGTYETAPIDGATAPRRIEVRLTPDRKTGAGARHILMLRAQSTVQPSLADAAQVSVQVGR